MLASINYILKMISVCIIPMILLMFGKEMLLAHNTFTDAVVNTVSAIIGMIPEGLVLMASMVLAVSVIRLATNKTLAQDLYCVETLARVDVLCLDKTGTITEGRMEVSDVISLDGNDHEKALCTQRQYAARSRGRRIARKYNSCGACKNHRLHKKRSPCNAEIFCGAGR